MGKVEYRCQYESKGKVCNKPFMVEQGSRRQYCDDHLAVAVTHADRRNVGGRPIGSRPKSKSSTTEGQNKGGGTEDRKE